MNLSITGHFGPEPFRSGAQVGYGAHLFCPPIRTIIETVGKRYNIKTVDIVSGRRRTDLVRARQIAIYLCRMLTPATFPVIGRAFGNRDHSTIMYSIGKVDEMRRVDPALDREVSELLAFLGN
jgi:chromosomal replication initiator protein